MRSAPTISRRSTAIGWRRAMVSTAFSSISRCKRVDRGVGRHHALGEIGVALGQRIDRIGDLLLGQAAHLGDHAGEVLQVDVEGLGGVFGCVSSFRFLAVFPGASAEAAGDVVLRAPVARAR